MVWYCCVFKEIIVLLIFRSGEYIKVLTQLSRGSSPDLIYQFSPVLIKQIPEQTVETFMKLGKTNCLFIIHKGCNNMQQKS